MAAFPTHAQTVIIGGGIIGCSVAYHLTLLGQTDVVLLERAKLTSGSTHHAAGLVGQLRSNANITQLLKYSVELYDKLEVETGQATGWKMNGGLRLACTAARMIELKRQATTAHSFGLEMHLLSAQEAQDLWPLIDADDVVGAAYLPTDGQANPADITQALVKGARARGARIFEDCPVTAITITDGHVAGVATPHGDVACQSVVNCGGQWARDIGALAGVAVPVTSVQHQYLVTETVPGLSRNAPTLRDPDRLIYFKEEVGGLVMGGYEPNPIPWAVDGIPPGFHFTLLDSDWDHFEPMMEHALARVPALQSVGVKDLINGPEAFTPDGNFILGEAPAVKGFFVGCGFNAFGIAAGGGAGWALAQWIADGAAPLDLWPVDIRRFGAHHADPAWVRQRTLELYAKHYTVAWPFEEHDSARPRRTSPLFERLQARGACFGEKMAWERPNWFAPAGIEPKDVYAFGRQNWFTHVGNEHRTVREAAGLFDQSSFAKFTVTGTDAEAALTWICAGNVAKRPGSLTYTQMLNSRGGIECDLTVSRFAEDQFYIVTGTGFRTHDFAWIREHIASHLDVRLEDLTDHYGTLSLMGPRARDVLSGITDDDVANAAFPFARCREIVIAGVPVRALRVTYVGELGWELHFRLEHADAIYDAIVAAGEPLGLVDAGYRAIESLRLEKGYRAWAADIGPDHTPLEAGLGWAVKLNSGVPFLGRDALLEQGRSPLNKRLACFTIGDPQIVLLGRETIYRNGRPVGWLSSAGWGYTVEKNIGYGYVRRGSGVTREFLESGTYELEIAAERLPCEIQFGALYDPALQRIKS